ncbi:protein translocase subunit SecD [bacterium]|nr:protein translocase subunit SecD [bacterium]
MAASKARWWWILAVYATLMLGPGLRLGQGIPLVRLGLDLSGGADLLIKVTPPPDTTLEEVMPSVVDVLGRRLDPQGTQSITVQRVGSDRISIQVPSSAGQDPSRVRRLVEQAAHLEFVHTGAKTYLEGDVACRRDAEADLACAFSYSPEQVIVQGEDLLRANVAPDSQFGGWQVAFELSGEGAGAFGRHTASHIGQYLTIVLDGVVQSSPRINGAIYGGRGVITGSFSIEEATELSLFLNAGRLAADLEILRMSQVGPVLGRASLEASKRAGMIGLALVAIYMLIAYRRRGVAAVVALGLFSVALISLISSLNVTLTLPGIAGLILSVGMAVDANVIIFERIKEEEARGLDGPLAIEAGFGHARTVILDANTTTMLIALVLYSLASGPVRGFAVTLAMGIAVSLFTALVATRALLALARR